MTCDHQSPWFTVYKIRASSTDHELPWLTMTVHNKLVHPTWAQGGSNGTHHHLTRIDVADDLRFALRGISALLQQDNGRALGACIQIKSWALLVDNLPSFWLKKTWEIGRQLKFSSRASLSSQPTWKLTWSPSSFNFWHAPKNAFIFPLAVLHLA